MRAQLLDGGTAMGTSVAAPGPADKPVASIVSAMVGIQAQDQLAAQFSIRARGPGLVATDVDRALAVDRSLVLTWSLRGTRHIHHAADVRWLLGLLGPVFARPGRRAAQLGIAGDVGTNAVRVLGRAVAAAGSLTRPEVKARLAGHGVDPTGQAAVHVLHRAAMEGVISIVPGPEERYVILDDWVPPAPAPAGSAQAAGGDLVRRYLAGYGPATPADFATWSGLGADRSRAAWAALAGELVPVDTAGGTAGGTAYVLASQLARVEADAARGPVPLRLVGAFDVSLLAYADRRAHLSPEHAGHINRGGGMVRPVILDDGAVIGTWAYRSAGGRARVAVEPFGALSSGQRAGLAAEVADIGRFLGRAVVLDAP